MVSGFLTSPWLHWRISSAVASPIRSSSKKLTSSTLYSLLRVACAQVAVSSLTRSVAGVQHPRNHYLDLFNAARLPTGEVDSQFLCRAEHLVVGLPHLQ